MEYVWLSPGPFKNSPWTKISQTPQNYVVVILLPAKSCKSHFTLLLLQIKTAGYRLHSLGNDKTQINFSVEPSPEELKVRQLSVVFSKTQTSTRTTISWSEPAFNSGFLVSYLIDDSDRQTTLPAVRLWTFVKPTRFISIQIKPIFQTFSGCGSVEEQALI